MGLSVGELQVLLDASLAPLRASLDDGLRRLSAFEGQASRLSAAAASQADRAAAATERAAARAAAAAQRQAERQTALLEREARKQATVQERIAAKASAASERESRRQQIAAERASARATAAAEREARRQAATEARAAAIAARQQAAQQRAASGGGGLRGALGGLTSGIARSAAQIASLYATIAATGAAIAGVLLLKQAITSASEQEDAIRKLNTALSALGTDGARQASEAIQAFAAQTQRSTGFADEATVGAAARIAAFVKEQGAIVSLTGAAQDFAQATGTDLETAANLLGKSVGSSTNALARYGIQVTGAVGSSERLQSALKGIERVFGGQARSAALSFSGAAKQVSNAFGEVLESVGNLVVQNPAVISLLGNLRDGFFELAEAITANSTSIARGLLQALASTIGTLGSFAQSLADAARFLGDVGVTATNVGRAFLLLRDLFGTFVSALRTGFLVIKVAALEFLAAVEQVPNRVRDAAESFKSLQNQSTGKLQREFADLTKRAAQLREEAEALRKLGSSDAQLRSDAAAALIGQAFDVKAELQRRGQPLTFEVDASATRKAADAAGAELIKSAFATEKRLEGSLSSLAELFGGGTDTAANERAAAFFEDVAKRAGLAQAEVDRLVASFKGLQQAQATGKVGAVIEAPLDPEELEKGQKLLKEISEQQQDEAAKLLSPLAAQAIAIERQVTALREATLSDAERVQAQGLIVELEQKRNELLRRGIDASAQLPELQNAVNEQLARLAQLDPQAAGNFANEVGRRLAQAIGPEAQAQALAELATELGTQIEAAAGPSLARASGEGLAAGVQSALSGENGLAAFGQALQRTGAESLSKAFSQAADGLGRTLEQVFGGALRGLGGIFAGILGGVVGALTTRTEASSAAGNVRSAVDSAQQVRGLVAGPSQVAISQVGDSIRDAFREPNRLLGIIARNTGTSAAAAGRVAGTAQASSSSAGLDLGNTSASLV